MLRDSFLWILFFFLGSTSLSAQGIFGYVRDEVTFQPIPDALVEVYSGNETLQTFTDKDGYYSLSVPGTGSVTITYSKEEAGSFVISGFLLDGYSRYAVDGFLTASGVMLKEVAVQAISAEAQYGVQKITLDDLPRIAGHNDDPVRIAQSLPGVTLTNDQANHFSFRGQAPILNTWMLEGMEIVNPNHLNNAGTFSDQPVLSGGGVNLFSAQALSSSSFFTGISGMRNQRNNGLNIDFQLRENPINEVRLKAGLIGLEAGISRTLGKSWSVHANARYSFTGILTGLGLDFGGEKIGFYDGVFSITNKTPERRIKLFGWIGESKNDFNGPDSLFTRQKDFFDIFYKRTMGGAGIVADQNIGRSTVLSFGASWSKSSTDYSQQGQIPGFAFINFNNELQEQLLHLKLSYRIWFSAQFSSTLGIDYSRKDFNDEAEEAYPLTDESLVRPHLEFLYQPFRFLEIRIGGEYVTFPNLRNAENVPGYFGQVTAYASRQTSIIASVKKGIGQSVHYGLGRIQLPNTRAELGFQWKSGSMQSLQHQLKGTAFYNASNKMPVGFIPLVDLIQLNDYSSEIWNPYVLFSSPNSKARQFGVEGSWNAQHPKGWLMGTNFSIFDNKRSINDAPLEQGRYSTGFGLHAFISKEIFKVKKEKNRIWHFSLRAIVNGGLREQQINVFASANQGRTRYVDANLFSEQLPLYKRLDVGIARTISHSKLRWRFALDVQNAFGLQNEAFHYWDAYLGQIVVQKQLSIVPVLSVQLAFTGK